VKADGLQRREHKGEGSSNVSLLKACEGDSEIFRLYQYGFHMG